MSSTGLKATNLLKDSIGKRIKKLRNSHQLAKNQVLIDDDDSSRGSGDGTLINCIEKGEFKSRTRSFIPNQALDLISKKFFADDPNRRFKIVYGNRNNLMNFIEKIYILITHNFNIKDSRGNPIKNFVEIDDSLKPVTNKIIEGLFFDAEFTLSWYKDRYSCKDSQPPFLPNNFSDKTESSFSYASTDFFEQIKNELESSYRAKFIADDSLVSLKKFDERVISWIQQSWPKILSDQIEKNQTNILFAVGYDVKTILEETKTIRRLELDTFKIDQLAISFYEFNKPEVIDMEKLKIDQKSFLKVKSLIHDLIGVYNTNAKLLSDMQRKLRNEMPIEFSHYFSSHNPHFVGNDTSLNDMSNYDFFETK